MEMATLENMAVKGRTLTSVEFEELIGRPHRRRIYNLCRKILYNHADAEDVTQKVMISAYLKFSGFRGDCELTSWLHRIAVNQSINMLKYNRRRPLEFFDSIPDMDDITGRVRMENIPDNNTPDPERVLLLRERNYMLWEAIGSLRPDYKEAMMLDMQGCNYQEAAEMLGIPNGTYKSRLFRARRELREKLKSPDALRI